MTAIRGLVPLRSLLITLMLSVLLTLLALADNACTQTTPQNEEQQSSQDTFATTMDKLMASLQPIDSSSGDDIESPMIDIGNDGYVHTLGAPPSHYFVVHNIDTSDPVSVAKGFLKEYGAVFGITSVAIDFQVLKVNVGENRQYVKFQQLYTNIPVFGGEVIVQVSSSGVEAVMADIMTDTEAFDNNKLSVVPTVSAASAQQAAITILQSLNSYVMGLQASEPDLIIYDPSVVGNNGSMRVVWRTTLTDEGAHFAEVVLVDAHTAEIVLHYSLIVNDR